MLAACSSDASEAPPDPGDLIECALAGASAFARDCAVDKSQEGSGRFLVVRHPDGVFRRFAVLTDGHGLASADGNDEARIALHGEGIEVAGGADLYRFPARIAGDGQR